MSSRHRKLDAVVARLQMQHGPRALRRAPAPAPARARLSTTFPALDAVLQDAPDAPGGVPRGQLTLLSGPVTSGKVTLAAKILSTAHADRRALVAWIDPSRTCDPDYLQRCGLDLDRLLVVHPEDALDGLAVIRYLVESNTLAGLVFDSLTDLSSRHATQVAGHLAHLAQVVGLTQTAVLFLAETGREHPALLHHVGLHLRLTRERWLTQAGDVRGYEARVEVVRQRPGRTGARIPIRIVFNGTVRGDGL
jgi:RecA/RadA recombinase